jgi:hypothetical protein
VTKQKRTKTMLRLVQCRIILSNPLVLRIIPDVAWEECIHGRDLSSCCAKCLRDPACYTRAARKRK